MPLAATHLASLALMLLLPAHAALKGTLCTKASASSASEAAIGVPWPSSGPASGARKAITKMEISALPVGQAAQAVHLSRLALLATKATSSAGQSVLFPAPSLARPAPRLWPLPATLAMEDTT